MKRSGPAPSSIYFCFKEPKTNRLYKIQHTCPPQDNNTDRQHSSGSRDDGIEDAKSETIVKTSVEHIATVGDFSLEESNKCLPIEDDTLFERPFNCTTEVLIVNFAESVYPSALESWESTRGGCESDVTVLIAQQTDRLVDLESVNVEIETLRHEISSCSGKPLTLVFTYNTRALEYAQSVFDQTNCAYAVSPAVKSIQELVVYLKTINRLLKRQCERYE